MNRLVTTLPQRWALTLALLASLPWLTGFVLLSSQKATLPASAESPIINFVWDGKAPSITDKDKFKDGQYEALDDVAFMQQLMVEAMNVWNAVPGAFITLAATQGEGSLNEADGIFSVVVEKSNNLSSAAFARPKISEGDTPLIEDCDVSIADKKVDAESLAFTIAHELGHCLGLGHSHTNYNAMMGYSRSSYKLKLGADDMAGLIYLYPDPDSVPDEPKELVCGAVGGGMGVGGMEMRVFAALLLLMPLALAFRATPAWARRRVTRRTGGKSA